MHHGACRVSEFDHDDWFADANQRRTARAAAVCAGCPVRAHCLAWALIHAEAYGVWGGLDPTSRAPLLRRLARGETLTSVLGFDALNCGGEAA